MSTTTTTTTSVPSSTKDETKKEEPEVVRMVPDVVAPPIIPLSAEDLFDKDDKPRLDVLKAHLLKEGRLSREAITKLLTLCAEIMKKEKNVLALDYPVTVVGDIHGQFFDLVRLFEVGGDPSETQYLFLGDYVDRGCFGTEVIFYLWCLKIVYPKSMFFLRGNHECRQLTAFFNFKNECSFKYDLEVYEAIMKSFESLPIAAIINNAFYCVHGGLSPDMILIQEMQDLDRFREVPREGPMCDFLWSDPFEEEEGSEEASDDQQNKWFGYNETRQCSYIYGLDAVKHFLAENALTSVIRAHEAQVDGYKMHMVDESTGIPRVITIFSAPNYCDVYKNKAACLKFDNAVLNIKQYVDSAHPYYLPNFMDVFQWSLPFVAEKVTDMLANILEFDDTDAEDPEIKDTTTDEPEGPKAGVLKNKVLAVTKVLKMYRVLRENHERILQLKQLMPSEKLPVGLLEKGDEGITEALSTFKKAQEVDLRSGGEAMPDGGGSSRRSMTKGHSIRPKHYRSESKTTTSSTSTFTIVAPTSID